MTMQHNHFDPKLMGIRIMQKRKEKGLRQRDLAEQLDLSNNHISNIERGKYLPSLGCLLQLCEILDETPDYFLLGIISKPTEDILLRYISQCSPDEQETICRLLETYLEQKKKTLISPS